LNGSWLKNRVTYLNIKHISLIQADEVTVTLPVAAGLDRGALIGKGGIYLTRLQVSIEALQNPRKIRLLYNSLISLINFVYQDTHMVHIKMPQSRKEDNSANGNDSDITIRGPRKGVEAVKREVSYLRPNTP
jgi:hypothetical protein